MNEVIFNALDTVNIGIIIIDENKNILIWNRYIEKLSNLPKSKVINMKLSDVCPVFLNKKYQEIIDGTLFNGVGRFCSSALHKAFIYPAHEHKDVTFIRQNMKIEPLYENGKNFAMLEIIDISSHSDNERNLKSLINQLEKGYKEIKTSEENHKKLAATDILTGLPNRLTLMETLENIIANSHSSQNSFALLYLDLDGFKSVNDTYGHSMGDLFLKKVSEKLLANLRSHDFVFRISGDEFAIIISEAKSKEDLELVAKKLIFIIENINIINDEILKVHVTASIGISIFPIDGDNAEVLLEKSDRAMYKVKKSGKNSFRFFNTFT